MAKQTETLLETLINEIQEMHTTLGTGLLKIHEALLADRNVEVIIPPKTEGGPVKQEPKKPAPETDLNVEVSKEVSDWIEAHPGCKTVDVINEFKLSLNRATAAIAKYGKALPKKASDLPKDQPKKEETKKVTVEMLRAKISEFADRFSMNEALAVNEQYGGSRKVSGIPETSYEKVFNVMDAKLKEKAAPADAAPGAEEKALTKEDIQRVAKPFVDKNGDPAFRALLKAIGKAEKISLVDPKFYPALHEALSNA